MMTTNRVSRRDGTERMKRFLKATVNGVVYSIEVFENPKPAQPLEEFIAESKESLQYNPAAERNLTVNGFAGKEYSSQTEATTTVMQFFATEDRLFRFAATGPVAAIPAIKEFFSSIEFGPAPNAIDVTAGFFRPDTGERVYSGRDVDIKPRLLKKPERLTPRKPSIIKLKGSSPWFSQKRTRRIYPGISGSSLWATEASIKAAQKIEFVPAMKDGKAVSMSMQLEYYWSL